MRTIVIIGGIILAGATVIAVVQNDKKKDAAPEVHQAGDVHEQPVQLPASPSATPTINPAHGLPGHRCDLAVGAPLPAAGTAAPAQSAPVINMNPAQMQPASKAPVAAPSASGIKINPAHGLPGHRCDLQVGAPLT